MDGSAGRNRLLLLVFLLGVVVGISIPFLILRPQLRMQWNAGAFARCDDRSETKTKCYG
jgi:hypothetical protein